MANVLNFSTDNLITGVNIIGDGETQNLYWTDDRNEPKKIEINRFKADDISVNSQTTAIDNRLFDYTDITVIRPHPTKVIELDLVSYDDAQFDTVRTTLPEPPFENIFPRFSYRWRYEDGQYSPYAPFTQAAFLPKARVATSTGTRGEDDFVPNTEEANYIEGFNTTLYNNVGRINLNNIPRGTEDVVEIDLLYTESISSTIYVLETLVIPEEQRGIEFILTSAYVNRVQGDGFGAPEQTDYSFQPLSYTLSTRKIYSALPANQLTRPFDNVPRLAQAQEVTANRLIYANYLHQYNQPDGVNLTTTTIPAESFPGLSTAHAANRLTASRTDGLHVKGNRTYEIGVAYIDAFGRQGGMLQNVSTFNDDGTITEASAFRTNFHQENREAIQVTIDSDPPSWADSYRYFIKDVSQDHHSLISYNIYNDGGVTDNDSEFVWIEFQSTDRNKVQAEDQTDQGTVLVLRRDNDNVADAKQRFLVQDIQNEAPNDVRNQLTNTITNVRIRRIGVANHNQWSDQDASANSFTLQDVSDGINYQVVFDAFNSYLTEFGIPRLVHEGATSTVTVSLTAPMVDGNPVEITPLFITFSGSESVYYNIESISVSSNNGTSRNRLTLGIGERFAVDLDTGEITATGVRGLQNPSQERGNQSITLYTNQVSDAAVERLGGRFWVRAARNGLETLRSQFSFEGELESLQQIWFETEPAIADSQLDLFWETSDTFCVCTDHGYPNKLNWFNSLAEVHDNDGALDIDGNAIPDGVYLESTRINDKFNTVQIVKGVRVNVPQDRFAEERRSYGLTWSGIYNSRTGINRLNQFITADGITKEIEPNYGSIQKLHTRNTNVVVLAEDKVFNILADKDLLFNADGGGNVSAANAVLGQTTPYIGEYGIGKSPESFATYGYRAWFADPVRGCVIEFIPSTGGQAQMREISQSGMSDFFRDRLFSSNRIHGMFNEYGDKYIVSMQGYNPGDASIDPNDLLSNEVDMDGMALADGMGNQTAGYELDVKGWPSRYSYIPEGGISLGNKFFTWNEGRLYMHNSNTSNRNNFYGTQYDSEVQIIFNDNPSAVKEYLTLGYEGTGSWEVQSINTENDQEVMYDPAVDAYPFVRKEGKYFKPIMTMEQVYAFTNNVLGPVDGQMQEKSGVKGFYNNVRLRNTSTDSAELFAINTENYISSN